MSDQPQYPSYPGPEQAGAQYPPAPSGDAYLGAAVPYAGWWIRVGAYVIDGILVSLIAAIPVIAGILIAFQNITVNNNNEFQGDYEPLGFVLIGLGILLALGFDIWNRGIRLGTKGQSLGKQIVGVRTVKADTGQVMGAGTGFLRWLLFQLAGFIPFGTVITVLWPLWDDRKQTLHDKIVSTVSLRT